MLLIRSLMEAEEAHAKHIISKLQRDRDCGAITDEEYEEQYETVMQNLRLRFAQVMDWASWEAYKNYK